SAGNVTEKQLMIPAGTKVEVIEIQDEFARVQWDSDEGWTKFSNLLAESWDLTYATRFTSEEKLGLETTASKETRIRYEEDGTMLLGVVSKKNANKRDSADHNKVLPDILDQGQPCLVLEQDGQGYVRVLDYAGTWNADAVPAGWWTRSSNITIR